MEPQMSPNRQIDIDRKEHSYGFGWTLGVGDGQGGLACCDSWGRKELDRTALN